MAARREQERLARVGIEPDNPLGHELGVQDLLRPGAGANRHDVGVVGVAGVDRRDRAVEAFGVGHRPRSAFAKRQRAPRWRPNQSSVRLHASAAASALNDGARVAMEAVLGVGVANDLGVDRRVGERLAQLLDVVDRDRLVEVAEQPEPRRLHGPGAVDEGGELREAAR